MAVPPRRGFVIAEIRDELVLDIDEALRDINRIEQSLDRALAPIEVEVDTTEVQQLEDVLREVERIANRAATETSAIDVAAGRAEVNFEDMARALNISEDAARDLSTEILEAQAASNRLEDSARDVARQLGLSEDEARRFVTQLQRADRAADDINTRTGTLVGTFGSLRGAAVGVAAIIGTIGLGQGISLAVRGIQAALGQFQALNESINAVQVTFGLASDEIFEFGEVSAQAAGLSAQAFQQAVVPLGAVLTNFGFSAGEAADASVILVQRAADLASVFNTDVSEALLAINSALVGQVEPLRRYGAEVSVARTEQFALATGLVASRDEFDEQARVAARVGLILQDTAKVQGDFAATSDELANAQRVAAAETQEFAAGVGEDLAPAMAELVSALPGVLDGLTQLVPLLAGGADSAADFFDELGKGGNVREVFATIAGGIEAATTPLGFLGESASIIFDAFRGDLDAVSESTDRLETQLGQLVARGIGVNLAKALDQGADSIDAVGEALSKVSRSTVSFDVFTDSFRDFAIQAELSEGDLFQVAIQMLANAEAAELTAEEIAFLEGIFRDLGETLDDSGRANADYIASIQGIDDDINTVTTTFTTFTGAIEDGENRTSAALTELAANAEAAAQRTQSAFDLFAEAPEAITTSFADAVEELAQQVEDTATFEANLARLGALGLDALVADFKEKGPAAASQVVEALNDLDLARDADQLLQGIPGPAVQGLIDGLAAELVAGGITQESADLLLETFDSPIVRDAVDLAARSVAASGVDAYAQGVEDRVTDLGEIFDPGRFVDFTTSTQRFYEGGLDAGDAYESGLKASLEITSPSRVMMRIAEDAAAGFLQGWEQTDLQLRTPAAGITGSVASTVSGASSGGVHVELHTHNPTVQDEVSDVARMGQIASSIAASYRSVVPNGM